MRKTISCVAILLTLLATNPAAAHFVWIAVEKDSAGQSTVQVWFSEQAEADDAKLIDKITQTKAWLHTPGQAATSLELKKVVAEGGGSLAAAVTAKPPLGATASCKYGVIERNGKVFLLNYYAKYLEADPVSLKSLARVEALPLDVVPQATHGGYEIEVLWKGKPAPECEVTVNTPDAKQEKLMTDKSGKVKLPGKEAGLYSIRAKLPEEASGEEAGKAYKQVVHYTTLALRIPATKADDAKPATK